MGAGMADLSVMLMLMLVLMLMLMLTLILKLMWPPLSWGHPCHPSHPGYATPSRTTRKALMLFLSR